jgi:hypothetical protein
MTERSSIEIAGMGARWPRREPPLQPMPRLNDALVELRKQGYLSFRVAGDPTLVSYGPRVRELAREWGSSSRHLTLGRYNRPPGARAHSQRTRLTTRRGGDALVRQIGQVLRVWKTGRQDRDGDDDGDALDDTLRSAGPRVRPELHFRPSDHVAASAFVHGRQATPAFGGSSAWNA